MAKRFGKRVGALGIVVRCLAVVVAGGFFALNKKIDGKVDSTTKTLTASAFSRYLLDDETGKATEDTKAEKGGLSTDKYYGLDDVKIEFAEDAEVKVYVNYYNENHAFLGLQAVTEDFDMTADKSTSISNIETAKYVKFEIEPTADEDGEVSLLEKNTYAGMVTITVGK